MKKILLNLIPVLLLFSTSNVIAQEKKSVNILDEKQTIQSSVLGETRELQVYTPEKITTKLPLILVFDGGGLFSATVSAVRFMNYYSEMPQMPEAIIIGIQNTDRNRDMPIPQQYGGEKGEDNFTKFVKDELIPWANKKYSLNGHVISIGHSQGAFFVSYLLAKYPANFPWIVALDAPVNVSPKGEPIKEMVSKTVTDLHNKARYASIEAAYGWGNDWAKYFLHADNAMSLKLTDETHESMAFTGIYEGLKFLYKDFAPARKDMNLTELKNHYQSIAEKYGYNYEIPFRVLTASASRKLPENRKSEIMELLNYAEQRYGTNDMIAELRDKTATLSNATNSIVDSFFALSAPDPEQIKRYVGTWIGQFTSKEGEVFPNTIEISIKDGKAKLITSFNPMDPGNKQEPEIFHVTKEGKLVFGIRNRGGGIIVNTLDIDTKGHLAGEGSWLGFAIPEDAPDDVKKQLTFLLTTPTKFNLAKQ